MWWGLMVGALVAVCGCSSNASSGSSRCNPPPFIAIVAEHRDAGTTGTAVPICPSEGLGTLDGGAGVPLPLSECVRYCGNNARCVELPVCRDPGETAGNHIACFEHAVCID